MKKRKKLQFGFGLVEVIVSITIMTMVVLALNALSRSAYYSWENASNKAVAYNLVQEEMEKMHNLRDTNAVTPGVASWYAGIVTKSPTLIAGTIFTEEIKVDDTLASPTGIAAKSRIKITVIISWQERLGQRSLSGVTYLTNWKPRY